jgi:hypothetical protein
LEPVNLNRVQAIPFHHTFKIRDGVFIGRVCIPNPSIEVSNGTIGATGRTGGVVSDEIDPFIDVAPVDPTATCPNAIGFS